MASCFALVLPSGAFYARFWADKADPDWWKIHRAIQCLGAFLALAGLTFAVISVNWEFPWEDKHVTGIIHRCVGCVVVVSDIVVLQAAMYPLHRSCF